MQLAAVTRGSPGAAIFRLGEQRRRTRRSDVLLSSGARLRLTGLVMVADRPEHPNALLNLTARITLCPGWLAATSGVIYTLHAE
jgi:hypothetical protein